MPNASQRPRAPRTETAQGETAGLAGGLNQVAALLVNAARTRLRRRALWRYQRAGYRPYVDHTNAPADG